LFIMAIGAQIPNSALTSVCYPTIVNLTKLTTKKVYVYHRRHFRIRYAWNSISANPRWCCSVHHSPARGLYCNKVRW
jgi:hypothetical protein